MSTADIFKAIGGNVAAQGWIYPLQIDGRFQRLRTAAGWLLIAFFALLPLLRYEGLPLVLFDIPARRFVVLGHIFWPQDMWLLIFLGVAAGLALFLFTAAFGRVWCGYACPQSVWLGQVFFRIERIIDGSRAQQIKLAHAPWTTGKIGKRVLKHGLFLAFSSLVAHIFLAYFMDVRHLVYALFHPSLEYATPMMTAAIVTGLFYADFAFFREQVCNYMCPYARFQSALLDEQSLIVAYDTRRGEPRGKVSSLTEGDCVDCSKCVAVCPQGIDIRHGLQLECIHCAACADACDSVMGKLGRPAGLIRYASEAEFEQGKTARLVRPRTIVYLVLLTVSLIGFGWQLAERRIVDATLLRPPGPPFIVTPGGRTANHFRIDLVNKDRQDRRLTLALDDLEHGEMAVPGNPVYIAAGTVRPIEVFVSVPANTRALARDDTSGNHSVGLPFSIHIKDEAETVIQTVKGTLILPAPAAHD